MSLWARVLDIRGDVLGRAHVVSLTVLFLGLLVWAAVATPVLQRPDEAFHYGAIMEVSDGDGWSATLDEPVPAGPLRLRAQWRQLGSGAPPSGTPTDEEVRECRAQPDMCGRRLTLDQWGTTGGGPVNRALQHPPFYYALTAAVGSFIAGLVPALHGMDAAQHLVFLRIVTALVLLPLPWLTVRTAAVLGLRAREQWFAALAVMAVPGFFYLSASSLGPDALLVALASGLPMSILYYERDPSYERATVLGAVIGLAAFTKAPGLAVGVAAGLALWSAWRAGPATVVRHSLLMVAVAIVAGGWWWLRNILVFGELQPLLNEVGSAAPVQLTGGVILAATGEWITKVLRAFWGLFMVPAPQNAPLRFSLLSGLPAAGAIGLWLAWKRSRTFVIYSFSAVLISLGMVWLTMVLRLGSTGMIKAAQGRYLYPLLVPLGIGLAILVGRLDRTRRPWSMAVWPAVILGWHVASLSVFMRRYGPGGTIERLQTWAQWAPLPSWAGLLLVIAVVAAGLLTVGVGAVTLWRHPEELAKDPDLGRT